MGQIIHGIKADYAAKKLVGQMSGYSIYSGESLSTGKEYLLKIASTVTGNGLLDREAFLLRELHEEMSRRDTEHQQLSETDESLGYQRCFPRLEESVLCPEQGNCRVNVIAVYGATSMSDLVPLEQWRTRALARIDPKSSAWIMGRLLKIFTLTHPMGVAAGGIDGGNILINPKEHHVVLFDWTQARRHEGSLPQEVAREEISQAAIAVMVALGGNPETGELPESEQLPDSQYADFLKHLVEKRASDPASAGARFYGLIRKLWGRDFHAFTTIPLERKKYHG